MEKFVKVPLEEFMRLVADSSELAELESYGVDNWPGYEECSPREEHEIAEEDIPHKIIEE